ncbi:hypothetical protein GIB67_016687, partial [Kingdonia uniflora]
REIIITCLIIIVDCSGSGFLSIRVFRFPPLGILVSLLFLLNYFSSLEYYAYCFWLRREINYLDSQQLVSDKYYRDCVMKNDGRLREVDDHEVQWIKFWSVDDADRRLPLSDGS